MSRARDVARATPWLLQPFMPLLGGTDPSWFGSLPSLASAAAVISVNHGFDILGGGRVTS